MKYPSATPIHECTRMTLIKNMSRIGKKIITLPEKVSVETRDSWVVVKGPRGELSFKLPQGLKISNESAKVSIEVLDKSADRNNALWGTARSIIDSMIKGVVDGYEKKLEIEGVGFKAQAQGDKLILNIGFSHPVEVKAPPGIVFKVEKNTIVVAGIDKFLVGEVAATVRRMKKPEPYKGKGIRYLGEVIRRKAGKKATTTGA